MFNKPSFKLLNWISFNNINWSILSLNKNAIELLEDKINWYCLSLNKNGIKILKENQNNIYWYILSKNKNAIKLLEKNQDKINWNWLIENPSIFKLDYKQMVKNFKQIAEEILEKVYNPDRIKRLSLIYNFKFQDWFTGF